MKKALKIIKRIGLVVLSLVLILLVYLGITGFPKPSSITTENVPRLPFSYLNQIKNSSNDFSNYIRPIAWSQEEEAGIYVRFASGTGLAIGFLDGSKNDPILIDDWPSNIRPMFHPDPKKRFFLYLKDNSGGNEKYQIYRFDLDSKENVMLSNGNDSYLSPRFVPETNEIIYSKTLEGQTNADLYIMDLSDPKSDRLIYKNENTYSTNGSIYIDDFSPDGSKVALRLGYYTTIPALLEVETGELTLLEDELSLETANTYHEWSEDGEKLYYASSKDADFSKVRVRNLIAGTDSLLIKDIDWDMSNVSESPDGKWLVFNVNQDGTAKLKLHHIETGKTKEIENLPKGNIPYSFFNPNANATVAFHLNYLSGETDIFSYDLESEKLKQWTNNKEAGQYVEPEVIKYPTFDVDTLTGKQREISAVYYKPNEEFEKPYPVIIELHGGPNMQVRTQYDPLIQPNLNRGIATIAPNFRGSRGYGYTFMNLDYGKGRGGAVKDIGALLDWIGTQSDLDASRVIVSGGSYGGYLSLACATEYSDRLLGAIDYFGISDLVLSLEGDKNADRTEEYGDVNDPEIREYLDSISPINNVEKINIPIFIFQGAKDARVLPDQSRKMVKVLKDMNKEYWYLEASDEGHGPSKPWNIVYIKTAEFTFVDKLLFE